MKRKNRWGSIFLVSAAAGFAFCMWEPWLALQDISVFSTLTLRALLTSFFEASLVGAVADWFAVTALFRKPLGLPLPHTDILARKKDDLAEAVPRFLSGFLQPETLSPIIERYDFAARLEDLVKDGGVQFQSLLSEVLQMAANRFNAPAVLASVLTWAQREGYDDTVIVATAELIRQELAKNRSNLVEPLTQLVKKNAGWKGRFVGPGTIEKMLDGINEELAAVKDKPEHALRSFFKLSLADYAAKIGIKDSPEELQLASMVKNALQSPKLKAGATKSALDFVGKFQLNPGFREAFNTEASRFLIDMLEKSRIVDKATVALASILKKTEPREFVQRVEEAVWNDLQYIRVNGAVVGGLVGVALSIFQALGSQH